MISKDKETYILSLIEKLAGTYNIDPENDRNNQNWIEALSKCSIRQLEDAFPVVLQNTKTTYITPAHFLTHVKPVKNRWETKSKTIGEALKERDKRGLKPPPKSFTDFVAKMQKQRGKR